MIASAFVPAGCTDLSAPGSGVASDDGALRGELGAYMSDFPDGHSETHYVLRAPSGVERALLFDRGIDVAPGTEIKVWGADSPEGFHVTSLRPVSSALDEVRRSGLIAGTPYTPRSFAFVLVNLSKQGFNPAITEADVLGRMISNADSIRNYYLTDSYGRQDITTDVFGPIDYTLNGCNTNSNSTGPGQLATDLRAMIPGTYQHYLWYFGTNQTACQWSGLASVGTPDKPSKDTWYNASTNCVVLVQEPGHNFGMQHSSSLACPGAEIAEDPNTCTVSEYGDQFDPMGGGCRHMNAWQKAYQGWFGGCNGVAITQSGVFTLLPFEPRCDGAQFLKIKAPKARALNRPMAGGGPATTENLAFYYVELRTPVDFDGMLGNRSSLTPQLLIHIADDLKTRSQRGVHPFLLDMTPTTTGSRAFNDAALPVGRTFTDPAGGLSITATAISATQATVTVMIDGATGGPPTCLDGTTFEAPGPGPESCMDGSAGGAPGTGSGGAVGSTGGKMGSTGGTGMMGTGGAITGSGGATGNGGRGSGGRTGSGGGTSSGGATGTGGRGEGGGSTGRGGGDMNGTGGSNDTSSGGRTGAGTGGMLVPTGSGGKVEPGATGGATPPGGEGLGGSGTTAPGDNNYTVEGGCHCAVGSGSGSPVTWSATLSCIGLGLAASRLRRRRR